MKVLRHYLRLNAKAVVYALVMAAIAQSCLLLDPLIMQHVLDRYSHLPRTAEWSDFLSGTAVWLGAIVASVALAWISKSEQTVTVERVSQLVGAGIFSDGVRSCLRMPFFNFEKQRSGERVEGLHRLRRNIEKLLKTFFNKIFTSLLALVLIIVYTTHVYWGLTLCFLTVAPTLTWISFLVTRSIRKTNEELLRRHSGIAGNTTETLRNIELVKSLGLTQQEISRFDEDAAAIVKLELRKVKASRVYTFFHGACVHLMRLGLLTLLLYLRFRNLISMGQFLAIYLYSYAVFGPMQELGGLFLEFRETEASLTEFSDLLLDPPAENIEGAISGKIRTIGFDRVSFRYPGRANTVLKDICFHVDAGETVAFVGPSGAGKTTLVKLICALYPPLTGSVLFNDIPATELDPEALRMRMGLVTQDTQLFSGSIRDNLLVVRPESTDDELLEKLQQASAMPILNRAPSGLDTLLGEGALRLSGGERQRIAIARALLREPDLILFDEATSSLDAITEREIAESFLRASRERNMMSVLIAHRLSTVVRSDRIYVLDKGEIVESGTHRDLLRLGGLYWRLWQQQQEMEDARTARV